MSDWLRRLQNSRRARNVTLAAIGVVGIGSCAGAGLAGYTVAGMNVEPYRSSQQYAQSSWREDEPEWVRDTTMAATGDSDSTAGFSSTETARYSDASY